MRSDRESDLKLAGMAARGCARASVPSVRALENKCVQIPERERERRAHSITLTLSQAHERPKRRKVREYAFWKRREVVVVKTKHAESRSEGESGLTLEFLSCTRTH